MTSAGLVIARNILAEKIADAPYYKVREVTDEELMEAAHGYNTWEDELQCIYEAIEENLFDSGIIERVEEDA